MKTLNIKIKHNFKYYNINTITTLHGEIIYHLKKFVVMKVDVLFGQSIREELAVYSFAIFLITFKIFYRLSHCLWGRSEWP